MGEGGGANNFKGGRFTSKYLAPGGHFTSGGRLLRDRSLGNIIAAFIFPRKFYRRALLFPRKY